MTFSEYMQAVFNYYMIGGTTWDAAYMNVLKEARPELAAQVVRVGVDPVAQAPLGDFLHLVFRSWGK